METTQLVQQNQCNENLNCDLTNETNLIKPNSNILLNGSSNCNGVGGGETCLNGENQVVNTNGDCETNKMLNKPENIEMSTSTASIKCCNGFFLKNAAKKNFNKKSIVKETQTNGNGTTATGNGKYFNALKEKLTNGKHTPLIDEKCDTLDNKNENFINCNGNGSKKMCKKQRGPSIPTVFDDRDPFKINSNVKFEYLHVFAEPNSGTYSFNPTWSFTAKMYYNLKLYLYRLFAILIGIPSAFICAVLFAFFSVVQIWLVNPLLRLFKSVISIFRDVWSTIIDAILGPIMQTIAVAFRGDFGSRCSSTASSKSIYNEDVNVV